MSTSHVMPVIDYESPGTGGRSGVVALPRRTIAPAQGPDTAQARAAGAFADATLRRVLEVIDRRRPLAQLRTLLAPGLVDSLLSAAARQTDSGAARLRRVRVQLTGMPGTTPAAAEVAASYTRGEQVHAIACRVAQVSTATGPRWQVVALHLG